MFGKCVLIVLALGVMATTLLSMRQQRFELASRISRAHWRLLEQERKIGQLRAELAADVSPTRIRQAIVTLPWSWQPIPHRLDAPRPPSQPRLATRPEAAGGEETGPVEFGG
jgi:hypothetical protein